MIDQTWPDDFVFGVSSVATSIEGTSDGDGRGRSIWDAVAAIPGRIVDDSRPTIAADHLNLFQQDVAWLAELAPKAYRFSLSWPRIQPGGVGPANAIGLEFYDRLLDGILAVGVQPWVTLYQWDLPLELMENGGWLDRATADRFADFTAIAAERMSDRVAAWVTMSDPLTHMALGHAAGIDAPGLTLLEKAFPVTHHLLLAHGRAVEVLRSNSSVPIGIANLHTVVSPATPSQADRKAARLFHVYHNDQFAEPILAGRYPRLMGVGRHQDVVRSGDLATISGPLDFYGVNYDNPTAVVSGGTNSVVPFSLARRDDLVHTDSESAIHPDSLTQLLVELHDRFPAIPPLVITANGGAFSDSDPTDLRRIAYLESHLAAVHAAMDSGIDVRGYFYRSLTDGWEFSGGFTHAYGLIKVNQENQARQPRAAFEYYRQIIAQHSAPRVSDGTARLRND